ncbi:MAG: hypothetical protein R6V19_17155 [Armatimonadota bacterium]
MERWRRPDSATHLGGLPAADPEERVPRGRGETKPDGGVTAKIITSG